MPAAPRVSVDLADALDLAEYLMSQRLADPFDAELIRCIEVIEAAIHRSANSPPVHHIRVVPPPGAEPARAR